MHWGPLIETPVKVVRDTFVSEAKKNLLTWFRIFISWLFCNQEEIGCGRKGYCCGISFNVCTMKTSYSKRCTRTRRVCWCKFGWNPTRSFCVICNLVSLSLIQRQGLSLDFACLFIYSLAISPEFFVCLSIYENAETCPLLQCVAVCCSVLQCVVVCYNVWQCVSVCCGVLQCVAVYCSVLQSMMITHFFDTPYSSNSNVWTISWLMSL